MQVGSAVGCVVLCCVVCLLCIWILYLRPRGCHGGWCVDPVSFRGL